MESLRKQIQENCAEFFKKIVEGKPQVRELEAWEEKPEASYLRLKKYYQENMGKGISDENN